MTTPTDPDQPSPEARLEPGTAPWRERLHEIIFEADTLAGKAFDIALLIAIALSVIAIMLESVVSIEKTWGHQLRLFEWTITILFTVEYLLRLLSVRSPWRYATSFFGIVDLIAIAPTFIDLFAAPEAFSTQGLMMIRTLRLIRVFRIFKLHQYVNESQALLYALRATRRKISVFLLVVLTMVLILGSTMYMLEGKQPDSSFTSIPKSVYWAVVTMTTVGYGDIAPQTPLGQAIAAIAMILGYAIIVVPTGIFSVEIIMAQNREFTTRACPDCSREGHDIDAVYCKHCSAKL